MAKLLCYSWNGFRKALEANGWNDDNLPSDWIFISIGESFTQPCFDEPHPLQDHDNVINLNFDDITAYRPWDAYPDEDWTLANRELNKNVFGMSEDDANRLFDFLDKNIGKNIMVHCSAGLSRSQGVVRFLLDCYPDVYTEKDTNPDNPCQVPNIYVTSMLKRRYYAKFGLIDD